MVTIKSYAKRYGVDRYTTYANLRTLGWPLPASAEQWAQRPKPVPKVAAEELGVPEDDWIVLDGRSFFVAGYTSGSAPYGVFEDEVS